MHYEHCSRFKFNWSTSSGTGIKVDDWWKQEAIEKKHVDSFNYWKNRWGKKTESNYPSILSKLRVVQFLLFIILLMRISWKRLKDLDASKTPPENCIPTKIIWKNAIFFSFIYQSLSIMIDVFNFPISLKSANIKSVCKKCHIIQRKITELQQSWKIYQIFTKGVSLDQCQITFKIKFQNFNAALVRSQWTVLRDV